MRGRTIPLALSLFTRLSLTLRTFFSSYVISYTCALLLGRLWGNQIRAEGARHLAEGLRSNSTLLSLKCDARPRSLPRLLPVS